MGFLYVENNFLGSTSSDKLEKAIERIKRGDKSLATDNELILPLVQALVVLLVALAVKLLTPCLQ